MCTGLSFVRKSRNLSSSSKNSSSKAFESRGKAEICRLHSLLESSPDLKFASRLMSLWGRYDSYLSSTRSSLLSRCLALVFTFLPSKNSIPLLSAFLVADIFRSSQLLGCLDYSFYLIKLTSPFLYLFLSSISQLLSSIFNLQWTSTH
ncbi:hypothetical protein CDAR_179221 [Caerostris darwini]|uniref:Uncharacterized protein n=1 Tax=Caerostris darwini TaxID=1538125 RepID=A0AAV4PDU5_9ARAC|nr:hypothetical protein CDAR_179221 [Caerostris darwini]